MVEHHQVKSKLSHSSERLLGTGIAIRLSSIKMLSLANCHEGWIRGLSVPILLILLPDFNAASSMFHDIVAQPEFVDRSRFLELFLFEFSKPVYITAPSQFGKSMLISMMEQFYDIQTCKNGTPINNTKEHRNYGVFTSTYERGDEQIKLDIANSKAFDEHFGKYPVFKLNFQDLKVENHRTFLTSLRSELHTTFEKYGFLLNSTHKLHKYASEILSGNFTGIKDEHKFRDSLIIGTSNLTRTLFKHFNNQSIIVLIDAFDAPISKMLLQNWKEHEYEFSEIHETLSDFMRGLFLKLKSFLAAGLITGRTRHGGIYAHRAEVIDHIRFTEMSRIAFAFALTEPNVEYLLSVFAESKLTPQGLGQFFGGYRVGDSPKCVLNTKLTIESIKISEGTIKPLLSPVQREGFSNAFRLDHAGLEILRVFVGENVTTRLSQKIGLLNLLDLNDNFQPMAAINTTWKNYTRENVERLTEYLHDLGYFTSRNGLTKGWVQLMIPNVEIWESLLQELSRAVYSEFNLLAPDVRALQSALLMLDNTTIRFQDFMDCLQTLLEKVTDVGAPELRGILFLSLIQAIGVFQAESNFRSQEKELLRGGLNFLLPLSKTVVVMDIQVNIPALDVFKRLVNEGFQSQFSKVNNRILVGLNFEPNIKRFSGSFSFNSETPTEKVVTEIPTTITSKKPSSPSTIKN